METLHATTTTIQRSEDISIEELHQTHHSRMTDEESGEYCASEAASIVEALGGLDEILSKHIYFTLHNPDNQNIALGQIQMNQIHSLLKPIAKNEPATTTIKAELLTATSSVKIAIDPISEQESKDAESDQNICVDLKDAVTRTRKSKLSTTKSVFDITADSKPKPKDFTYSFSTNDTILHAIASSKHTANNIIDAIYNMIFVSMLGLCGIVFLILDAVLGGKGSGLLWFNVYRGIFFPVLSLWLICVCFTMNRHAFNLVVRSFEFWFKIAYCVGYIFCDLFYRAYLRDWSRNTENSWQYIWFHMVFLLVVIVFSLFDALRMNVVTKAIAGVVVCLVTVYQAWLATAFGWTDDIIYVHNWSFQLSSFMSSSLSVLAIFLIRQTFFSVYAKGRKCVTIKHGPWIEWKTPNALSEKERPSAERHCSVELVFDNFEQDEKP